ncbi:hypothetical protein HYH03_007940 [Edaphochlamys debaryana]|uniref:Uncharacterized protein n=1 Tax=Edaphochlamys debaryana TaxID=47281 RepID=A0A835Y161_9CHLO|nr:hypothetical protein HYH03_007940 [Edaphochlamys debaryana]|eukprot:KAG2494013.1 hypothetical protein HYH03_007940 [Edaphochlamys debaryana]
MSGSRQPVCLETIVRQLSVEAGDQIIDALLGAAPPAEFEASYGYRNTNCSSLRASSRYLRDFVDGATRRVYLKSSVGAKTLEALKLERWPRVTSLDILLEPKGPDMCEEGLGSTTQQLNTFVLMPATPQSLSSRQRITSLAVRWESDDVKDSVEPETELEELPSISPLTVSHLALLFPALRELNLDVTVAPKISLHLRMMYDTLAALPYMDTLRLPTWSALSGIGALATSLKRLRISAPYGLTNVLAASDIDTLCQLKALEELRIEHARAKRAFVGRLLESLPEDRPTLGVRLEFVVLEDVDNESYLGGTWDISCRDGVIERVECTACLRELAAVADSVTRRIKTLLVTSLAMWEEPVSSAKARLVIALVKRCEAVDLRQMLVTSSLPPVLQAVGLLGLPSEAILFRPGEGLQFELQTRALKAAADASADAAGPGPSRAGAATASAATSAPGLPSPREVLQRAVDSLASANPSLDGPHLPGSARQCRGRRHVFLVRGPFISTLALTPAAVVPWLAALAQSPRAQAARQAAQQEDPLPARQRSAVWPVTSVQLLPGAGAMLVRLLPRHGGVEMLQAAAAASQQALGQAQGRGRGKGKGKGQAQGDGDGQGQSGFELRYVGDEMAEYLKPPPVLTQHVQQVMQSALDSAAARGATPAACLEWVVAVAAFWQDLPERMRT